MLDVLARLEALGTSAASKEIAPFPLVPAQPETIRDVERTIAPYVLTDELRQFWMTAGGGEHFEMSGVIFLPPQKAVTETRETWRLLEGPERGTPTTRTFPRCLLGFAWEGKFDTNFTELQTHPAGTGPVFQFRSDDEDFQPLAESLTEFLTSYADFYQGFPRDPYLSYHEWAEQPDQTAFITAASIDSYPDTWKVSLRI